MGTGHGLSTVSICGSVLPLLKPDGRISTSKLGRKAAKPPSRLDGPGFRIRIPGYRSSSEFSSYSLLEAAVANYTENRSGRPI